MDKTYTSLQKKFNNDFELSQKINKTFKELMTMIFKEKRIYQETFCEKTDLSPMTFSRLKNGEIPKMKTLIAFCISFEIGIQTVLILLNAMGHSFIMGDRVHYAYSYLITNYSGTSIYECNRILEALGIEEKYLLKENSR